MTAVRAYLLVYKLSSRVAGREWLSGLKDSWGDAPIATMRSASRPPDVRQRPRRADAGVPRAVVLGDRGVDGLSKSEEHHQ
jgi:hypothetical protein